ncbi:hypothetical protein Tco_1431070, partial [Tanacetum coccineum]
GMICILRNGWCWMTDFEDGILVDMVVDDELFHKLMSMVEKNELFEELMIAVVDTEQNVMEFKN